jgi:NAD(P)H-dependent FMN reductase
LMCETIVWRLQTTRKKARKEYNHSYPGELKMLLDMLFSQYAHKPVGICGVSSGAWGGTRMVEQLRLVCLAFHLGPHLRSRALSQGTGAI